MSVDHLLSRLDKVKQTGAGRYLACCPAHEDRKPSLAVRELDDGRVLVHCFSGCAVHEVLDAVGLGMDALFPPRELPGPVRRENRPFPAADVLRAVAFEALVVLAAGTAMLAGEPLGAVDRARLMLAVSRLQAALDAGGVRHG